MKKNDFNKYYKLYKDLRVHGQKVYKDRKKNLYISLDVDSHNGGTWKIADSPKNLLRKETRMGTYDENFNRIGD